jgi:hypothetical protein
LLVVGWVVGWFGVVGCWVLDGAFQSRLAVGSWQLVQVVGWLVGAGGCVLRVKSKRDEINGHFSRRKD